MSDGLCRGPSTRRRPTESRSCSELLAALGRERAGPKCDEKRKQIEPKLELSHLFGILRVVCTHGTRTHTPPKDEGRNGLP
jgi:hypothetical protein